MSVAAVSHRELPELDITATDEPLRPVGAIAEQVTGSRPHPTTVSRWCGGRGASGIKLPSILHGGRRMSKRSIFSVPAPGRKLPIRLSIPPFAFIAYSLQPGTAQTKKPWPITSPRSTRVRRGNAGCIVPNPRAVKRH
ncbi:DUF1580 domain-containing protein [Aeoliella sp.]|uniref:DUF1580 domain-containing protein n=1 Tax=Aeoliella sp. TaxID=2795800 RepID=UPI003CCC3FFA